MRRLYWYILTHSFIIFLGTVVKPWNVPLKYFKANRNALQRRAAMVPYTYSLAREAYDTGLGPLRAMYYEYPKLDNAYNADMTGKQGTIFLFFVFFFIKFLVFRQFSQKTNFLLLLFSVVFR